MYVDDNCSPSFIVKLNSFPLTTFIQFVYIIYEFANLNKYVNDKFDTDNSDMRY